MYEAPQSSGPWAAAQLATHTRNGCDGSWYFDKVCSLLHWGLLRSDSSQTPPPVEEEARKWSRNEHVAMGPRTTVLTKVSSKLLFLLCCLQYCEYLFKVKVHTIKIHSKVPQILNFTLDGSECSVLNFGYFVPTERSLCTHWIEGWVGPRANTLVLVKIEISVPCRLRT
jgi:hypothetical protein